MSCSTTGATGQEVLSRKSVNQARLRDSQSRSDRCVAVPGTRAGERVRSQRQWRDHGWRGGLPSPPLRWGLITAYRLDAVRVSVLAFARFPGSQMCLRFTKTSGRGYPPDPHDIRTPCRSARKIPVRQPPRKGRGAPGQHHLTDCTHGLRPARHGQVCVTMSESDARKSREPLRITAVRNAAARDASGDAQRSVVLRPLGLPPSGSSACLP